MADLRKILAEATPEQLAAALIKAEEALRELVDRDAAYDGNRIIITADSHGDAIGRMSRARAALSEISALTGGRHD